MILQMIFLSYKWKFNNFNFEISPTNISDDNSFYKFNFNNDNYYFGMMKKNNFLFYNLIDLV